MPPRLLAALAGIAGVAIVLLAIFAGGSSSPCHGGLSDPADLPSHHDAELEARIPDTVAGQSLEVQSVCANRFGEGGGLTVTPALLESLGVVIDDVTYAANTPQIGSELSVSVSAWRYRGASEDAIRTEMLEVAREAGEEFDRVSRAGKEVDVGRGPMMPEMVFYVEGDTLYMVQGADTEVHEVLEGLP
jgi:hypothetical protein